MKAKLKQTSAGKWSWTVSLHGRLPKGRYTVAVRGVDGAGNVSTKLSAGKPSLRIGR